MIGFQDIIDGLQGKLSTFVASAPIFNGGFAPGGASASGFNPAPVQATQWQVGAPQQVPAFRVAPAGGNGFRVGGPAGGAGFSPGGVGAAGFNVGHYTPPPTPSSSSSSASGGQAGAPSAGMKPGVAQWATQAQQVFGKYADVMLAIMTNESGGDPNAYNAAGNAWGLFQQVGLNSKDPATQFQAAKQLLDEKLRGIEAAYAKNGLNPDERTRARDIALAWAGHFDYDTGRPNPNSRDIGSGQTADQLAAIFLANYDNIVKGRQQASAPAGRVAVTAQGFAFPVVGYQGQVQLHWGSEDGGSDIMAPAGSPIVSMGDGVVVDASPNSLGGNTVTIRLDNGLLVYMAHMRDAPLVRAGQRVQAGTPLGFVGATGNAAGGPAHLHIGIGYDIISGGGPTGGLGSGFDAVTWLNQILAQAR